MISNALHTGRVDHVTAMQGSGRSARIWLVGLRLGRVPPCVAAFRYRKLRGRKYPERDTYLGDGMGQDRTEQAVRYGVG